MALTFSPSASPITLYPWVGPVLPTQLPVVSVQSPTLTTTTFTTLPTIGNFFPLATTLQQSIRSSILSIISTRPGERPWNPTYGINLEALAFEQLDDITAGNAEKALRSAISTWEQRVTINTVQITKDENNNQIIILIVMQQKGFPPDQTISMQIIK